MKAKVKFDSAQLRSFFLHHVEKVVFGGFVVAFLLICWSAFKLKPYEKTPDQLKKLADDISQKVESKTPPDKIDDLANVPDFSNLGAVGPAAVDSRFYAVRPLNLPYEEKQERRKEPKFFPLEDLLVACEYGGIAIGETGAVSRSAQFGGMNEGMPGMSVDPYGPGMGAMGSGGPMGADYSAQQAEEMRRQQEQMNQGAMGGGAMGGAMGGGAMGGAMGGYGPGMPGGRNRRAPRKKAVAKVAPPKPTPRPKPQSAERINISQPPAGSSVEGRYWVCLVGAIPYWKQLNEYQMTFRDARSYDVMRDYPRYALPQIERAEVNGSDVGDWEALDVQDAADDLAKWAVEYPEVVDPKFLDPDLTEPLPPLVFANHNKEKVNHPRTKVEQKPAKAAEEVKKKKATNLTGVAGRGRQGQYGVMPGAMPGMMPGGDTSGGYGGMGMAGAPGSVGPTVEQRLFRFFDFRVEPGKTYRYRVKLVLQNPNAGVQPRYLENYEFAKGAMRTADWSQPSPPVTVIAGNRLLAGNVTPGGKEPSAKVLAKLFDAKLAAEIRRVFDISRGSILNESGAKVSLPGGNSITREPKELDFETNAVVLDMFGGEKLPGAKGKSIPGHILVLDNDGELKTLVQSNDAGMYETEVEEAEEQRKLPAENKNPQAGPGGSNDNGFLDFNGLGDSKKKKK